MEDRERLSRIADRILAKSRSEEMHWERLAAGKTHFVSNLGDRAVTIKSEDRDDVAPFRLSIYSGGEEIAFIESIMGAKLSKDQSLNRTLAGIYRTAKSDALGINEVLTELERELDL